MKYLVYGLSTILTSSAAALAVLHYTAALAEHGRTDVVTVPAIDLTGARTLTSIVLGPGIPILAEEAADDILEPADQPFVNDLTTRTHTLQH